MVGTSRLADTSKPPTTIITAFPVNCTGSAMSRKNNEGLADTSKPPTTIITAFPVNCTRTAMSRKNNETPRKPCYAQRLSLHLSLSVPIAPKMQCQELTKHKQTHRNLLLCFAHQCTSCFHCTAKNAVLHSCGMKKENIVRHLS